MNTSTPLSPDEAAIWARIQSQVLVVAAKPPEKLLHEVHEVLPTGILFVSDSIARLAPNHIFQRFDDTGLQVAGQPISAKHYYVSPELSAVVNREITGIKAIDWAFTSSAVNLSCVFDSDTSLYSPWDMDVASYNFDAMCGHGALAAALGVEVCHVMQYFGSGGWINIPMMEKAIRNAGKLPMRYFGLASDDKPSVTIIQFLGSWMKDGVPPAARCEFRHWVARRNGLIWDSNEGRWQSQAEWETAVIPTLLPKRSTGWSFYRSFAWDETPH